MSTAVGTASGTPILTPAEPPGRVPDSLTEVVLRLADVPLAAPVDGLAQACLEAVRPLLGDARLVLPPAPVAVAYGAPAARLSRVLRFNAPAGEAELWAACGPLPAAVRRTLSAQLSRVWALQRERAARDQELDRLRFRLESLQQVAHTLAVLGEPRETERLVLDSVKEVFFAWWAALYGWSGEGDYELRLADAVRPEPFTPSLPASAVRAALGGAGGPVSLGPHTVLRESLPSGGSVLVPLELGEGNSGLLVLGPRITEAAYDSNDLALLRSLADASAIALRNAELLRRLRDEISHDVLTGCRNRRGFDERLALEFARARRYSRPLSLLLIDLDHFKNVNDEFGHDIGDHALRQVGKALRAAFRTTDSACRIGGEEFALLLPETGKTESIRVAERLRATLETLMPDALLPKALTASLGLAVYPDDAHDADDLVRAADRALYQAKAKGRNRIEVVGTTW